MRLLVKIFIVLTCGIIGLYFGGKYGIYLTENNIVDLGAPAGNLMYPFFWIIMAIVGGIISVLTGLIVFIVLSRFHKRNNDKPLTNKLN